LLGCLSQGGPETPANPLATGNGGGEPQGGTAGLRLRFVLPDQGSRSAPQAEIRSVVGTVTVTITLTMVNPGNASAPYLTLRKTVQAASGTASVAFTGLPARTTVCEVQITGGNIGGYADFRGASDLQEGENIVDVSPPGSGLEADFTAGVVKTLLFQAEVAVQVPVNLVALIYQARGTTDTRSATSTLDLVNRLAGQLSPQSSVRLSLDQARTTVIAESQGSTLWTKSRETIWSGVTGLTAGVSDLLGDQVVRHGLNGYGLVSWAGRSSGLTGLTRLAAATGDRMGSLLNPGSCPWLIPLENGDIVGGGHQAIYNCPVVFRWSGLTSATTDLASGSGSTGFVWVKIMKEFADPTKTEKPDVINLALTGQDTLLAHVRDGAAKQSRILRLNLLTGAYDPPPTEERLRIAATPGEGKVTLTWPAGTTGEVFNLYWGTATGVTRFTGTPIRDVASPYVHQPLVNGTTYFYVVTKGTGTSEGPESYEVSATPRATINRIPVVSVTAPASGTSVTAGSSLKITAFAQDPDGTIANVEFLLDGVKIAESRNLPYEYVMPSVPAGPHRVQARAVDNSGGVGVSPGIPITATGSTGGIINGTLKDDLTGRPIAGAMVALAGTPIYTVTNADGWFEITGLAPGTYDLVVRRDGFLVKTIPGIVITP